MYLQGYLPPTYLPLRPLYGGPTYLEKNETQVASDVNAACGESEDNALSAIRKSKVRAGLDAAAAPAGMAAAGDGACLKKMASRN